MARPEPSGGDPDIARVGRAVTARRLELGMDTQKELAERAGVALNTAAFLERGRTFPRPANARKLEIALDWPPGTLESLLHEQDQAEQDAVTGAQVRGQSRGLGQAATVRSAATAPTSHSHVLAIAREVVSVATATMEILLRNAETDPDTHTALRDLDAHLLALETVIAASLPHSGDAFDATQEAVSAVHREREAINAAAAQRN
ncbi:helix-turn-helix transcriptional regulator [Mycolicibacterium mageritense]|uniref:helix-turn-helix transcriptional regulator n=1 Tax=Mycolicibacterium mageritense TaxID=53462 RepID=UPI001E287502|nr:helix-turn-helix transcriptional regulator [Mycolicibacterium mageritense]GJJ23587.1 hypothetical protein MTY414_72600 [Mycolicibacterium mageritense]